MLRDSAGGCGKLHAPATHRTSTPKCAQRRRRRKRDALHTLFSVPAITRDDVVYWYLIKGEYYLKPVGAPRFELGPKTGIRQGAPRFELGQKRGSGRQRGVNAGKTPDQVLNEPLAHARAEAMRIRHETRHIFCEDAPAETCEAPSRLHSIYSFIIYSFYYLFIYSLFTPH